ncbi:MAG: hypothetical protein LC802_02420 [Acidobacteria bacterium]|nr:hypothetical protein [Acidobacteriota bacterium]
MQQTSQASGHVASAVVVAHPGHEVRIHGWLERERPSIFILTDGSGRVGEPRIASTSEYLKKFRMRPARIYGRLTDLEVYGAVLRRDFGLFVGLSEELAGALVAEGVGRVVGDASEGYNTTHDVCRLVLNAAVELARRAGGAREVESYDYPVVKRPDHCPEHLRALSLWLHLDEEAFQRKLAAAFEFYPQLAAETQEALSGRDLDGASRHFKLDGDEHAATDFRGLDVFRVECLRPVSACAAPFEGESPYYERVGEGKVADGLYESVIRYREHLAPLADALRENVERKT